jgi:hypothetical protein
LPRLTCPRRSAIASPAHADVLEAITGKPTYDPLGRLHVPVGVKNNGTEVYRTVHLECGLYRGSDLVGIGDTNIEWVYPGQTAYGTVQKFAYWFDEAAVKVDKADCRAASVTLVDGAKEKGR